MLVNELNDHIQTLKKDKILIINTN